MSSEHSSYKFSFKSLFPKSSQPTVSVPDNEHAHTFLSQGTAAMKDASDDDDSSMITEESNLVENNGSLKRKADGPAMVS